MSTNVTYDEEKLGELMLYVAGCMSEDSNFGATKLNKLLFFSDFFHYAEYGTAITGAEYQKLSHGPAPRQLLPVQNKLALKRDAVVRREQVGPYTQKRLVPLREPDLSRFAGTEIALVDKIISELADSSAVEVSRMSHLMVGWKIASEGETIPYDSVFLYDGPLSEDDHRHAHELAERLRPQLAGAGLS